MTQNIKYVYLSSSVDMSAWVTDGDSTHNFTVAQCAQLSSMAWNA